MALAAGADGLDVVRRLLRGAAEHLAPDGLLVVEVGASQPALVSAFAQVPFTWVDFERGGDGVFVLGAADLRRALRTGALEQTAAGEQT
jgi:ribosomal protein L3 glutamine methyltransferase